MLAETTMSEMNVKRLAKAVGDGRKDGLLIDCSRLLASNYGKMVEHFSGAEGNPVAVHNNKTLFLEGIDLWCRKMFTGQAGRVGTTEDPKEIVLAVMEPWYEAMELNDPSQYKLGRRRPLPAYTGTHEDALAVELGLAACLDVAPINLRYGLVGDRAERVWGRVKADGNWYDTDPNDARLTLGQYQEFESYEELEVPL